LDKEIEKKLNNSISQIFSDWELAWKNIRNKRGVKKNLIVIYL
jgi:hypothetical protein